MPIARRDFLSKEDVDRIMSSSEEAFGITQSRGTTTGLLRYFLSFSFTQTRRYRIISNSNTVALALFPFLGAQLINLVSGYEKIMAIILIVIPWAVFFIIQVFLPRDIEMYSVYAQLIKTRMAANRLAAQLALQHFTNIKPFGNDAKVVEKLSSLLDASAVKALTDATDKLAHLTSDTPNDDWRNSYIRFSPGHIPPALNKKMISAARTIAVASSEIFNHAHFTVKIYLLTNHTINLPSTSVKVRLLTAVARFPLKDGSNDYHGKSWIYCRGEVADVWRCHEHNDVLVFKSVNTGDKDEVYPSIACIPLRDGLGVVTIESSDGQSFEVDSDRPRDNYSVQHSGRVPLSNHAVKDDVRDSIALSVKELVVKAVMDEFGTLSVSGA